ncbi:DUF2303 family protein [Seohaeicola zhoushanensis]|uniref:DUF2303 family protein n=1 Tax=Seohaeicola zhoushanensis TaxID=1569283 RepID=A0A8J3H2E9_9RHOB|nr:DUF2303 family protein [Seohaeicola zhoushanensis]GHF70976.1 hypothetical protein GCM10017056_47360 [Seohaeicola zhoushanensis]
MQDLEQTPENVAQTMRDVMMQRGDVEMIPVTKDADGLQLMLASVPQGRTVQDFTPALRKAEQLYAPHRRTGTAKLKTLQSLIDWAIRFKGPESALFANPDPGAASLTCIANYHATGPASGEGSDPTARWLDHVGRYEFPLSREWKLWKAITAGPISKETFCEFIEANAKDLIDPTPALLQQDKVQPTEDWERRLIEVAGKIMGRFGQVRQLIQLGREFQVNENSTLDVSRDPDTGASRFQFKSEHQDASGRPISIPNLFLIAIPIFHGGDLYRLPLQFRYRKSGPEVKFILNLYDAETAFETACNEAAELAAAETELPLFIGEPEGRPRLDGNHSS